MEQLLDLEDCLLLRFFGLSRFPLPSCIQCPTLKSAWCLKAPILQLQVIASKPSVHAVLRAILVFMVSHILTV